MKDKKSNRYLISAIVWTVIALVAMCLAGQWLRWWKFR